MKSYSILMVGALLLTLLVFQGFQCASSEFTGAKVQLQQKNYAEAMRLLEIEVQKNPGNEEAWYLLGAIRGDEGNYIGMNEAFSAALKLTDKHAREIQNIRYGKWGNHLNTGVNFLERATPDSSVYYDESISEFQKAAQAWPDTSLTYRYLGYAYNNKGDFENAIKSFRTAWDKGKDEESLKRMARIHIFRGEQYRTKFENAFGDKIKALKNLKSLRKNSRKNDVLTALGAPDNIRKGARGSKRESWVYGKYNLTLVVEGDKVSSLTYSRPYTPEIDSTNHRLAIAEYNSAIDALVSSRETTANDPETLQLLLNAYIQTERIQEAIREYRAAIQREPDNKTNRYILGVLLRSAGEYEGAVEQFQKAYEIDPTYSDALFDLGATYYNWGVDILKAADEKGVSTTEHKEKFRMALPHMEKVAEQKPDDATVWDTLGTIYAQLGMQDKAVKAFDAADKIRGGK